MTGWDVFGICIAALWLLLAIVLLVMKERVHPVGLLLLTISYLMVSISAALT